MDISMANGSTLSLENRTQIRANELSTLLDNPYAHPITLLSLDCFDTLLWRNAAIPRDIFYMMQQRPVFKSLSVTAYQRIQAADKAYRAKQITEAHQEITLADVYANFSHLTVAQQNALIEEELLTEMEALYAFPPMVALIRQAHKKGIKIIVMSDTYFRHYQLRRFLAKCLPPDVYAMISDVFCSCEFKQAKREGGLYEIMLRQYTIAPQTVLHLGDHYHSDLESARRYGLRALHFLQYDAKSRELLNMQAHSGSLLGLTNPALPDFRLPRYQPFAGVFSLTETHAPTPEHLIGYMTYGPVLYTFADYIVREVAELKRLGKRPKVFFLLRDAFLLAKACEAFAGEPVGKNVHLRKFVVIAAQFRTKEDVIQYLSTITPQYFNYWVICEQLLLPKEVSAAIIQAAHENSNPKIAFYQLICRDDVLQVVFKFSAEYRARLKRYVEKELQLEQGDTAVLIDIGYAGVTQHFLTKTLQNEIDVEITGRYLVRSHEPDRPLAHSLMTSTACDHGLFEQCCTYQQGAVINYDEAGNPIFDALRLSEAQYARVAAIQAECLRFIADAKRYLQQTSLTLSPTILQTNAIAVFRQFLYLPIADEVQYLQIFQHDKEMGEDLKRTIFNLTRGEASLRESQTAFDIHPYEARAHSIESSLGLLVQRCLNLPWSNEEISFRRELLNVLIMQGTEHRQLQLTAYGTHDGFYVLTVTLPPHVQIGILFGHSYQWVQFGEIKLVSGSEKKIIFNEMTDRGHQLYECVSTTMSFLMLASTPENAGEAVYKIVFRPI